MRLVIQRVTHGAVKVVDTGQVVGKIGKGIFVLVGVGDGDTKLNAETLAQKLAKLRIMKDLEGKMNLSVKEIKAEILAVSQFTLYSDTTKGNRPSFIANRENHKRELVDESIKSHTKAERFGMKLEDTPSKSSESFIKAAQPKLAEEIYNHFVDTLKEEGIGVQTGKFGAYMEIEATLDGPVTIII